MGQLPHEADVLGLLHLPIPRHGHPLDTAPPSAYVLSKAFSGPDAIAWAL
jgi:hypothetical protein